MSLLFRNLDDEHGMAIYYKPHRAMDRLQFVLDPEGNSEDDRYRLLGYAGHEYVLRSTDMKFRTGVTVTENDDYNQNTDGHKYKVQFHNLMGEEKGAHMEVHSNGYIWVDPGKSHEFFSNHNHEFILRNGDNKPKVGVSIVNIDGEEL
jgi:hypothetical protein